MTGPEVRPARIVPFGERALLVELGDTIDAAVNARVHALADRVEALAGELAVDVIAPAYAALLVGFDPAGVDEARLRRGLLRLADEVEASLPAAPEPVVIPVRYGGPGGPDLDAVAARTGVSPADVVELHSGTLYQVFLLGFSPGFAYLGTLPPALRLPRRDEPRVRVPAGSVAIAAAQTAVYPHASAGGWHLLGHTDMPLWDVTADPPARLRPGDRVRFEPR